MMNEWYENKWDKIRTRTESECMNIFNGHGLYGTKPLFVKTIIPFVFKRTTVPLIFLRQFSLLFCCEQVTLKYFVIFDENKPQKKIQQNSHIRSHLIETIVFGKDQNCIISMAVCVCVHVCDSIK